MAHRAAHDLAQHIAPSIVGGPDAIVNQKSSGAAMVGGDAQGGIDARVRSIGDAEHVGGAQDDGQNQVGIVV